MLPFLDLYGRYLADPELDGEEILDLLRGTPIALDSIQDPNFTESYHSQLYAGLKWCVNIADAIKLSFDQPPLSSSRPRSVAAGRTPPNAAKPSANRHRTTASTTTTTTSSSGANTPPQPVSKGLRRPAPPMTETEKPPKKRTSPSYPARSSIDDFISFNSTSAPDLTSTNTTASSQVMNSFPSSFTNDFPTFNTEEQPTLSPTGLGFSEADLQQGRESFADFNSDSFLGTSFNPRLNNTDADPDNARSLQVFYKAGTLDNFMPRSGTMLDPWDMDLSSGFVDG